MKKTICHYGMGCLLLALLSAGVTSCKDDDATNLSETIYPESIELSFPDDIKPLVYEDADGTTILPMLKGEKMQLGYTMLPENVTSDAVVWQSNDEAVATVEPDGTVTAVSGSGAGYTIIQVSPDVFFTGSGIFSTVKVVVSDELKSAESITIQAEKDKIYVGETLQLVADILPSDATYRTVNWKSSDESVATVDMSGLVTVHNITDEQRTVTITAEALDGSGVKAIKELTVMRAVMPQEVTIDQKYASDIYLNAITDKTLKLEYTTVPAESTGALLEWSSSDESIATVEQGVVTFNQEGVFGDVTITATCPQTGNSSSIVLRLEEGLIRELFHDENNYTWYNAKQSGNGTESSHVWHDGYLTVTTYTQTVGTKQRGDFKCWSPKTWLHAGKYPIFAIRMEDVADKYKDQGLTKRNINLDAAGTCNGVKFSGNIGGGNNKYKYNYKCSDGSHVFIYDLSTQDWATGGGLPTGSIAEFTTLQIKYADMEKIDHQIDYNVYWVQTFKTLEDLQVYIQSEGLTYEEIQ